MKAEAHLGKIIDEYSLIEGVQWLSIRDEDLRDVVIKYGLPPIWKRDPGFPSLLKIILEQQVSLASAQATYNKLINKVGVITPESFLSLMDYELKKVGFSRQKMRYGRILANIILEGTLDMDELKLLSDEEVKNRLVEITGIGDWTASIYLLMVLGRPDIWPRGDLALNKAVMEVKGLDKIPSDDEAESIAEIWRPWRSVAARILWNHYLSR
jgi:DNA-3-methyladenine glycosylase II